MTAEGRAALQPVGLPERRGRGMSYDVGLPAAFLAVFVAAALGVVVGPDAAPGRSCGGAGRGELYSCTRSTHSFQRSMIER